MNGTNRSENILLTEDGKVQNPIDSNIFLLVTKCISSVIGIPLNLLVAIIIIRLRRLYSKPRHIFLLGIILSDLFIYVPVIIEFIYWIVPSNYICEAYVAVVDLPYAALLLNMLLALVDRYVAIKIPLWHRKRITVRFALVCFLLSSASIICITKFVYIFNFASIRCEISFDHSRVVGLTMAVLFVLCVIANSIVYRQTRTLLQKRHIDVENNVMPETIVTKNRNATCANVESSNTSFSMAIHVDRQTLHKMKMDATRTLITSVTSLFALALPPLLFFLTLYFCRLFGTYQCSRISWMAPYFKELLGLFHAAINPMICLLRNDEFRLVVKLNIDNRTSRNQAGELIVLK